MPTKIESQRRTMASAARDPVAALKLGIPQSVAKSFNNADSQKKTPSLLTSATVSALRKNKTP